MVFNDNNVLILMILQDHVTLKTGVWKWSMQK